MSKYNFSFKEESPVKNLTSRWEKVSSDHRHLTRRDAVVKNEKIIKEALESIGPVNYPTVVDWGPGGGFISKSISPDTVHYYDIVPSHESLLRKLNSQEISDINFHLVPEDLSLLEWEVITPDLLIAYSVIYHMPGLEYVNKVVHFWNTIMCPKTIAIRNMFSTGPSWQREDKEYYKGGNYIRGNLYNLQDFINMFTNYEVSFKKDLPVGTQNISNISQRDISLVLTRND